jgi:hypothetical protein
MRKSYLIGIVVMLTVMSSALTGCAAGAKGDSAGSMAHSVAMADAESMPQAVRAAPQVVADAYRFAAANPEVTQQIPCYCGCGAMGHESNYDCFWQGEGKLDEHALGCGICVDIAQDAMRGLEQGRSLQEIRQQVDADYSQFGPPTDTPPVIASAS